MTDPPPVRRVVSHGGVWRRRVELVIAVLVTVLVGIAIAKPWSSPTASPPGVVASPAETASSTLAGTSAPSSATAAPAVPTGSISARDALLPAAFTMPAPPPATASWTGIRWRRLAAEDQLTAVRSMVRWRGGFVAVGPDAPGGTQLWTSIDGAHWEPLPVDTPTTFWPGLRLLGIYEVPQGLMAITDTADASDCAGGLGCMAFMSWTSSDGRAWTPVSVFSRSQPDATFTGQLVAVGPAGPIVVSMGEPTEIVTSKDGVAWTDLSDVTFPAGYVINDLLGTAAGYVVGGFRVSSGGEWEAATLWSPDGRAWTPTDRLPRNDPGNTPTPGGTASTVVMSFAPGRDGMIAIGRDLAPPGANLLWQSSDGRAWNPLPGFPHPASAACTPADCGSRANALLVTDGQRMLALSAGLGATVMSSFDGIAWQSLAVSGDSPADLGIRAVVLPGGLLLFDGTRTWFGEAITP